MNRPDDSWMDAAACRARPDLGWLKEPEHVGLGEESTMAVVCDRCPVREFCDEYALTMHVTGVFWAGHHRTPDGPLLTWVGRSGDAA